MDQRTGIVADQSSLKMPSTVLISTGRKDRVDDAMHATRADVEEGVLPWGAVLPCSAPLKR
jgi:hypothetical protein